MLTSAEIGPFTYLIPFFGILICIAGVNYKKDDSPLMATMLFLWFIVVQLISYKDPFSSSFNWSDNIADDLPGVLLIIFGMSLPLVVFYTLYQKSEHVRQELVHEVPMHYMIRLNLYRIAGASFLYLYYFGSDASGSGNEVEFKNFTILYAGAMDVIIGLTAIPYSFYVKKHGIRNCHNGIMIWNFVGVVGDFVMTLNMFMANFLGLFQTQYPLPVMLHYPLSSVILFNVPLAATLHTVMMVKFEDMADRKPKRS